MLRLVHLLAAGMLLAVAPFAVRAADDIGITDDAVKIGSIVPLSGPAAPLSIYVRQLVAYTKYLNAEGGVKFGDGRTRKIEAIPIDLGGQPARALAARANSSSRIKSSCWRRRTARTKTLRSPII